MINDCEFLKISVLVFGVGEHLKFIWSIVSILNNDMRTYSDYAY